MCLNRMMGMIYHNWFHRFRSMNVGFDRIKKCRDHFSSIVRTPQYLRLCYALCIINDDQWRDLTAKEEQARFYAIEAVPILQNWLTIFDKFLLEVKSCKSSEELFEKVKQVNSEAYEYINQMDSLHSKYPDRVAHDIYVSTFIDYDHWCPYEPGYA